MLTDSKVLSMTSSQICSAEYKNSWWIKNAGRVVVIFVMRRRSDNKANIKNKYVYDFSRAVKPILYA